MKNITFLLLLFVGTIQAQVVNIPDSSLLGKLLEADSSNLIARNREGVFFKIDSNNDNQIQLSEALEVSELRLSNTGIVDATGLSDFANLTSLSLVFNEIIGIPNLNMLTNLEVLDVGENPITEFDVSALNNLEFLYIDDTLIISLDFSGQINLKNISCVNCVSLTDFKASGLVLNTLTLSNMMQLTNFDLVNTTLHSLFLHTDSVQNIETLNLSGSSFQNFNVNVMPNLRKLDISNSSGILDLPITDGESLTELNITHSGLTSFRARGLQLSAVDFTGVNELRSLDVSNSLIASLDLSGTKIEGININNTPISFLNIKNGIISGHPDWGGLDPRLIFEFENTPFLTYICVDEGEIPVVASLVGGNVAIGSYCSFIPGGTYNTITGKVRFDAENDGCVNDLGQPYVKLTLNDGSQEYATIMTTSGDYEFYTLTGDFTISPEIENPEIFTMTPQTATVNFPDNNNNTSTQDFCITANGIHSDLEIVLVPIIAARPGFDAVYKMVYKNKGNQIMNGNLSLTFNLSLMDFINSSPMFDTADPGILSYNFSNLLPFESREILITMNINSPVETNPVNINDVLVFTANIPVASDEIPEDNTFVLNQTVVGSYDPNDITCLQGDRVSSDHIGKYLHYNINFENTGTADAENVVIKDSINAAQFDIHSLQILNSSHAMNVKIKGNVIEFIFESINLRPSSTHPIGGHGNVLFKIKSKADLQAGSLVENMADIYFDYNAPIETNEAETTFALLNNQDFERDNTITTFPNPASDFVKIQSQNTIKSIQLFDIQGRILQTVIENKKETTIDLSKQSNGIYFLKISTEKGSKIDRIVKA